MNTAVFQLSLSKVQMSFDVQSPEKPPITNHDKQKFMSVAL